VTKLNYCTRNLIFPTCYSFNLICSFGSEEYLSQEFFSLFNFIRSVLKVLNIRIKCNFYLHCYVLTLIFADCHNLYARHFKLK
jgi:hypothetical protein